MAGTSDAQALLLTINADTSKVLKAIDNLNRKLSGAAPQMQASAKKAAEGIEKGLGGINFGKALDKVFDSSKLAVIEEGSTRLRIFGSALEPLGPLGIAAAAGIAALGAAFEETHKAIEYADGLYKAAAAAHVSTDALQEYQAALIKAGGQAQDASRALFDFGAALGEAQAGMKRGQRAFLELGFTPAQIKGFKDTDQALDAVISRLQQLKNPAQQNAVIDQLRLQGLAPLILAGADAWKTWREEAKGAGQVLDADVIQRGHALNVEMDELSTKIKNELTSAFVDLGPVLVGLLGLIDKMLDGIGKFSAKLALDPAFLALIDTSFGPAVGDAVKKFGLAQISESDVSSSITEQQLQAGLGPKRGSKQLKDVSKAPQDHTADLDKTALDALNAGKEAVAKANASLVDGILAHAQAEKDAVDAGLTKKLADLEAEAQKIASAKNDADKLAQRAKINSAKAAEQDAAELQKQAIDQKAATAALEQFLAYSQRIHAAYDQIAQNSVAMADTAAERNRIERDLLVKQQRDDLFAFDQRSANELKNLSGPDLEKRTSEIAAERGTKIDLNNSNLAKQAVDQADPIQKYARSIQDLTTEVQGDAVNAFQNLTSGLVDAALHAKSLGDVAKNVFLELIQQILTQELQKEALPGLEAGASALLHFIPGFAGGTSSAPGGLALVGENGPELVNLPRGAGVTPTFQTLDAINAMKAPAARAPVVYASAQFDLRGAVVTQDLLDQMNSISAGHARQAAQAGRALAVQDVKRAGYLGNVNL